MTNPRPPESPFDPDEHAEAVPLADDIVVNIQGHTNDEIIDLVRQQLADRGINVDAALRPAPIEDDDEDEDEEDEAVPERAPAPQPEHATTPAHTPPAHPENTTTPPHTPSAHPENTTTPPHTQSAHPHTAEGGHGGSHDNADEKAKKANEAERNLRGKIVTVGTLLAAGSAAAYGASLTAGSAVLKGTTIAAVNTSQLVLPIATAALGVPLGLWALGHMRYQIMKAFHVKNLKEPVSGWDYVTEGWKLVLTPVGVALNIPKAIGWSIGKAAHGFVTWGKSSGKGSGPAH